MLRSREPLWHPIRQARDVYLPELHRCISALIDGRVDPKTAQWLDRDEENRPQLDTHLQRGRTPRPGAPINSWAADVTHDGTAGLIEAARDIFCYVAGCKVQVQHQAPYRPTRSLIASCEPSQ